MISAFNIASITAIPWYKGEWSCEICWRPYICFPPRPTATTTISTNTAAVPHLLHNGASLIFMGEISTRHSNHPHYRSRRQIQHDQHERGSFLHHKMAKVNTLIRIEYGGCLLPWPCLVRQHTCQRCSSGKKWMGEYQALSVVILVGRCLSHL